jgi:hypothetical protein
MLVLPPPGASDAPQHATRFADSQHRPLRGAGSTSRVIPPVTPLGPTLGGAPDARPGCSCAGAQPDMSPIGSIRRSTQYGDVLAGQHVIGSVQGACASHGSPNSTCCCTPATPAEILLLKPSCAAHSCRGLDQLEQGRRRVTPPKVLVRWTGPRWGRPAAPYGGKPTSTRTPLEVLSAGVS